MKILKLISALIIVLFIIIAGYLWWQHPSQEKAVTISVNPEPVAEDTPPPIAPPHPDSLPALMAKNFQGRDCS